MLHNKILIFVFVIAHCIANSADAQEPNSKIKNVLFIISDDLKASVLGCYGDRLCKTPNIDELARRSVVFDRAYCQGTWCLPSRQSFMFGRYPGAPAAADHPSMAEHFKNQGWYSARVGKIYHMRVPGDIIDGTNGPDHAASWTERFNCQGLEAGTPGAYALLNKNIFTRELKGRESTGDRHRMFVTVESDGDGSRQPDYKAATKAIELLKAKKDQPFFLAVGLVRPHYPLVAPKTFFDRYPISQIELPKILPDDLDDIPQQGRSNLLSSNCGIGEHPDNIRRMWAGYYASVEFMDLQVGRILDELDRLGLRESTAIVFTSDHGYHLGEHQFWQKSNLHEESVRVPLIVSLPGKRSSRSSSLTELVDLYPTLVAAAGLKVPEQVQGKNLMPIVDDPTATVRSIARTMIPNKKTPGKRLLRTDRWAYMNYGRGIEELYDMNADPQQFHNLAKDEKQVAVLRDMRQMLQKFKEQ